MRRLRVLLLIVPLVAMALAGCASSNTTTSTPTTSTPAGKVTHVTAGTEAKYPPFEDLVNGQIVGFDIDVFNEIAKRAGFTVTYQNAAFDDIIPSVQSGQFDAGVSAFTITDARKQQVDFSIPYYDNALLVATLASNTNIQKESDLKPGDVRVCSQSGTTSEDWLRAHGYDNNSMTLLPDFPTCGESLKRGDVQAIMIDRAAVRDLIAKSGGQFRAAFEIPVDEHFGFAVKKGNGDLLGAVNAALNAMKSDGTLKTLSDKWKV